MLLGVCWESDSNNWNMNDKFGIVVGTIKLKLDLPIIGILCKVDGSALPIIEPFQEIGN